MSSVSKKWSSFSHPSSALGPGSVGPAEGEGGRARVPHTVFCVEGLVDKDANDENPARGLGGVVLDAASG